MTVAETFLDTWTKAKIGLPAHAQLTARSLEAYQLEKLRAALAYVKQHSPFYRSRFADRDPQSVRCAEDLSKWPFTTADDLRQDPLAFLCVSQSAVERVVTLPVRRAEDRPIRLFFSAADLELAVDFFHHGFGTQMAPGQRMLVLMPCRQPYSVGDLLCRGLARLSVEAFGHGPMHSAQAAVQAILQNRIDCLVGVPSQMAELVRHPGAARIPRGQIKSVWLGTENKLRSVADEIGRFWGSPVFQHYGAAEMCPGGGVACSAGGGFHLREADLLIEIVDPHTGRPAADGSCGQVVVTTLTRQAMPLIRYRIGHQAAIRPGPCPCGSTLRRLVLIHPDRDERFSQKGDLTHGSHCFSRL
jgi:phenylacetate-CoA ligase